MTDVAISESAALRLLIEDGDFTPSQARIVLSHARSVAYDGRTFYPIGYLAKRARAHRNRPEPDAWSIPNS